MKHRCGWEEQVKGESEGDMGGCVGGAGEVRGTLDRCGGEAQVRGGGGGGGWGETDEREATIYLQKRPEVRVKGTRLTDLNN